MNKIKVFLLETNHSDDTVSLWFRNYPGIQKSSVHYIKIFDSSSPDKVLKDALVDISYYSHLKAEEKILIYAGENTDLLSNITPCESVDLILLKNKIEILSKLNTDENVKFAPWILTGEIFGYHR